MFENKYPYTDFSQLNLDWFLLKFKELLEEQERVSGKVKDLDDTVKEFTDFVTNYFDNLDVQAEVNVKLNEMAADGTLSDLLAPLVAADIGDVVAAQIGDVVDNQIDDVVADQIGAVVGNQIGAVVAPEVPGAVTSWLNDNVDPVGSAVVVDSSLSISGAAADAKVTGDVLSDIEEALLRGFGVQFPFDNSDGETNYNWFSFTLKQGTYIVTDISTSSVNFIVSKNNVVSILTVLSANTATEITISDDYDKVGIYVTPAITGNIFVQYKTNKENEINSQINTAIEGNNIVWTSGYYANYSNGAIVPSENGSCTGFIACDFIERVVVKTALSSVGCAIAFYDTVKTYMQSASVAGTGAAQTVAIEIPENAKYLVCSAYNYPAASLQIFTKAKELSNPLVNKKVMFFGDSITALSTRYRDDLLQNTGMIQTYTLAISGATLCNGSTTVMDGNPSYGVNNTVPNQVQKVLNNSASYSEVPDFIIIEASTNDAASAFTFDEAQYIVNDNYIDVDTCDLKTASGAMRWIYEKLMTLYSGAKVFFVTPIQAAQTLRSYSSTKTKRDGIVENCERMSIYFIDAFNLSGIYGRYETTGSNGKYLEDGLHPNSAGAKVLAECIASVMKTV